MTARNGLTNPLHTRKDGLDMSIQAEWVGRLATCVISQLRSKNQSISENRHRVGLQRILSHPMPEQRFYVTGESVVNARRDRWHVVLLSTGLVYNAGALI